ncbi:MAG: dockerin type I repeat-containing protein, partial [candidate division Zixibacteria bacterium]|nr:dockerin type I repeat-containing protein [candidate division Zixibacteria bacterium]
MKHSRLMRSRRVFITLNIFLIVICSHATVKAQICGDANSSGSINIADGTFLAYYLVLDGLAPPNPSDADFDGYEGISIYDYRFNGAHIGQGGAAPICPPIKPAIVAEPNAELLLRYSASYPPNQDSFVMSIKVISPFAGSDGFMFPMKIRIDGQIPDILSIEEYCTKGFGGCLSRIVADSGIVLLANFAHWSGTVDSGENEIAKITLVVPPSTVPRPIEISWTVLSPINAPAQDSSLYPLFLHWQFPEDVKGYLPTLTPGCCSFAGDANGDNSVNIADVTYMIARIFAGGAAPICNDAADANGDNSNNIADLTYMIARIFAGGLA